MRNRILVGLFTLVLLIGNVAPVQVSADELVEQSGELVNKSDDGNNTGNDDGSGTGDDGNDDGTGSGGDDGNNDGTGTGDDGNDDGTGSGDDGNNDGIGTGDDGSGDGNNDGNTVNSAPSFVDGSFEVIEQSEDNDLAGFTFRVDNSDTISNIYAVINGQEYVLERNDDTYCWYATETGTYVVEKIVIESDESENSIEVEINETISYEAPVIVPRKFALFSTSSRANKEDEIITTSYDSEWLRPSETPEVTVSIDVYSEKEIKSFSVGNVKKAAEYNEYEQRYFADVTIKTESFKQGINDLKVTCEGGDPGLLKDKKVTFKVDDKAPKAVVELKPSKDENYIVREIKKVFLGKISVDIIIPADCDGTGVVSGLQTVKYSVNGKDKTAYVSGNLSSDGKNYVITERLGVDNSENNYEIVVKSLTDAAGNVANEVEGGQGCYLVDCAAPRYDFEIKGTLGSEDDTRKYYSTSLDGTVIITDSDIAEKSVVFTDGKDGEVNYYVPNDEKKSVTTDDEGLVTKIEYPVNIVNEGQYLIAVSAEDKAGNKSKDNTEILVIDKTLPEIEISPSIAEDSYYASNVTVNVKVNEKWFDKDSSSVVITKTTPEGEQQEISLGGDDWSGDLGDNTHEISYTTDSDGTYKVTVTAKDFAHPDESVIKETPEFKVDTTAPVISVVYNELEPQNGIYYNAVRVATITVDDFTFDEEKTEVTLNEKYGTASESAWSQTSTNLYEKTITFGQDGRYSFSIVAYDKAGNSASDEQSEFVIDMTAPVINVSYNGATPKNDFYYNETRVATVNIKDISFSDNLVSVSVQPISDASALPSLGGFSSDEEDSFTASMSFENDGKYGYMINCSDLAGNNATTYVSDVFIIDKTVPEVFFGGVADHSANNGTVAPVVSYEDSYIDLGASLVTLTGANNGAVSLANTVESTANGYVITYSDFAHEKALDDLYILNATVYDLAGNETDAQLVFSVNRFGSVFVLGDGTVSMNEQFYVNAPKDVVITEINVDDLTYRDVSVTRDGNIKQLTRDRNYQVAETGDDLTWKTYTYTITKDNFTKDGLYSVTIYTQDRATNTQDNKSRDAEVNFVVDTTAPSIVTVGLESDSQYKETSHSFNVDVTDNTALKTYDVYKNGKKTEDYVLEESDDPYTITVIASDLAGNKETVVYDNILVSTKEVVSEENDAENDGDVQGASRFRDEPSPAPGPEPRRVILPIVILAIGASAAAGTGTFVMLRKKKITK